MMPAPVGWVLECCHSSGLKFFPARRFLNFFLVFMVRMLNLLPGFLATEEKIMLRSTTHDSSRRNCNRISNQTLRAPSLLESRLCVHENPNQFMVSVELSEVDVASLDLWIEDHQLTLIADQKSQMFSQDQKQSRAKSSFFSCIDLPSVVDEDSITAEVKSAYLEISFKKERTDLSVEL
jgi:HSP20 family molecular chaperone IbpA